MSVGTRTFKQVPQGPYKRMRAYAKRNRLYMGVLLVMMIEFFLAAHSKGGE